MDVNIMTGKINLDIDRNLLNEAIEIGEQNGEQNTEKSVIEEALKEYIQRRKQMKILDLFGTIEYEENYDYKQQRQK